MRGDLPRYPRPFVGRGELLEALAVRLDRGGIHTLTGPAGVGKTRLAVEVARTRWSGRARFVDLQSSRGGREVELALRRALGAGERSLGARLRALGRALVVLDNAEHVLADVGLQLPEWRAQAEPVRWLVTSREALAIGDERCLEVPPFPPPRDDPAALRQDPAARIFAGAAPAGFSLTEADPSALREILQRLDGLPLAAELAAARLEVLALAQLRERLRDRLLPTLKQPRDRGGRHDAIRQAIADSWALLEPPAQSALAQLSIFAGGFSLEDVEGVVVGRGQPLLDLLHVLRRHHMVAHDGRRFRLLASIHAFADEALTGDERARVSARHARWFVARAESWWAARIGPQAVETLDQIGDALADLQATLRSGAPPATILRCLGHYLDHRVPVAARLPILDAALADRSDRQAPPLSALRVLRARWLRRSGDLEGARAALASAGPFDLEGRALAALERGDLRCQLDSEDIPGLEVAYRDALEAARAADRPDLSVLAALGVALSVHDQHDYERADELASVAADEARALNDLRLEGAALSRLSTMRLERSAMPEARATLHEAIARYEALGDRRKLGVLAGQLGLIAETLGELDEAVSRYREASERLEAEGDPVYCAYYRGFWGRIVLLRGEPGARTLLQSAAELAERGGSDRMGALYRFYLAATFAIEGDAAGVRAALDGAAEEYRALLTDIGGAWFALAEAHAADRAGARDAARTHLARARELADTNQPRFSDADHRRRVQAALFERAERGFSAWLIHAGGFHPPDLEPVDLSRRPILARILLALARARVDAPGRPLDVQALAAAGWPGEQILHAAAANRVRVALSGLRKAGLRALIIRRGGGWMLDPEAPVRAEPPA